MKFGFMSLLLVLSPTVFPQAPKKEDDKTVVRRIDAATAAFNEMMHAKDGGIADSILRRAQCIGIIPNEKRGAFLVGAQYGKGLVTCRLPEHPDRWSAPAMISIEGGSFGLQAGGGETDVVFAAMHERGVDSLMKDKFEIGADAVGMAGPVGREVQADTDAWMKAEILSWSRAHGLFAGVDLKGDVVHADKDANRALYGKEDLPQREILMGRLPAPPAARPLLAELARHVPEKVKTGE